MYGPLSSRFWLLRKHICSMKLSDIQKTGLPFYSWQCITILLPEHKQINLVIEDDDSM